MRVYSKLVCQNHPTLILHDICCVVAYDMLLTVILLRTKQAIRHWAIIWRVSSGWFIVWMFSQDVKCFSYQFSLLRELQILEINVPESFHLCLTFHLCCVVVFDMFHRVTKDNKPKSLYPYLTWFLLCGCVWYVFGRHPTKS